MLSVHFCVQDGEEYDEEEDEDREAEPARFNVNQQDDNDLVILGIVN